MHNPSTARRTRSSHVLRRIAPLACCAVALGLLGAGVHVEAASAPLPKPQVKKKKIKAPVVKPQKKKIPIPTLKKPSGSDQPGSGGTSNDADLTPELTCVVKTSDIIDHRIDIGAQYSLMRKMAGSWDDRIEASSIIRAVKSQALDGVLLPPRKAVADRGQRMDPKKAYWELIPAGQNSICLKQPTGEPPMIVYRTDMANAQIDAAVTAAWDQCNLPVLAKPCAFEIDLHKPADAPVECKVDKDCVDKQLGNVCNASNRCEVSFPGTTITGNRSKDDEKAQCYDQAWKTWRQKKVICENAEFRRLAECALDYASPVKLAKCLYDSYAEKETCKRQAFDEYEHKRKNVCPNL